MLCFTISLVFGHKRSIIQACHLSITTRRGQSSRFSNQAPKHSLSPHCLAYTQIPTHPIHALHPTTNSQIHVRKLEQAGLHIPLS